MASLRLLFLLPPPLLILLLALPSEANVHSFRPRALLLPLDKDSATGQYLTTLQQRTPLVPVKLVVDLGSRFLWVNCEKGYVSSSKRPVLCASALCNASNSAACSGECSSTPSPRCACSHFPDNTVTQVGEIGEMATDVAALPSSDGSSPGRVVIVPRLPFACGATFLLEGLAAGAAGMAGFGRTSVGLPSQLAAAFRFSREFALCLSPSKGVAFFGGGPYVLLPGVDVSKALTYTPLIVNPVSTSGVSSPGEPSADYFIGVKSIKIGGKQVPLNASLLFINEEGVGGTKFSTVTPYTTLHTAIYNAVITHFIKQFPKLRVAAVAPFGFCVDSTNLPVTRAGPPAPPIDFVLHRENVSWRFSGSSSMVAVKKNVVCLAKVDGGWKPTTSIVIGGHQLENSLLHFDLARNRLGFSSSLLFSKTTCANFNFTFSA